MAWPGRSSGSIHPPTRNLGTGPLASAVLEHARERDKGRLVVEQARREASEDEARIEAGSQAASAATMRRRPATRPGGQEPGCAAGPLQGTRGLRPGAPRIGASRSRMARARQEPPRLRSRRLLRSAESLDSRHVPTANRWMPPAPASMRRPMPKYVERHRAAKGADRHHPGPPGERTAGALAARRRASPTCSSIRESHRARGITPAPIPGLSTEHKKRLDQIHAIVEIARDDPPARFLETARQTLQTLCGDLLKPEHLEDDVLVYTDSEAAAERCSRKMLIISWKDQKRITLANSGFDEYTIPRNNDRELAAAGITSSTCPTTERPAFERHRLQRCRPCVQRRTRQDQAMAGAGAGRAPPGLRAPRARSVPRPRQRERADPDRPDRCPA